MRPTFYFPVDKEDIPSIHFPVEEVLEDELEIAQRSFEAKRAVLLGNTEHQKVRIFFITKACYNVVETTIWGLTENDVILKSNTLLPLKRVSRIQIL